MIDRRRRQGHKTGQFLVPGSASLELLKQSSESLAGRIAYKVLTGLTVREIHEETETGLDRLWLRGGFPDSVPDDVLGHPVVGASREGFVIENLLSCLPTGVTPWFYQTSAGAEIDLVIEQGNKKFVIEIKRSLRRAFLKVFI